MPYTEMRTTKEGKNKIKKGERNQTFGLISIKIFKLRDEHAKKEVSVYLYSLRIFREK